jgi:tetratricopeptide (TPR) repeat protein
MDFLNWRNIVAILLGGALAGLLFGAFKAYKNLKREEIAQKLYRAELYLQQNNTQKAEELYKEIPEPSKGYIALKLGDWYFDKNLQKSEKYFREAASIFKEVDKPLSYFATEKLAFVYRKEGNYQKSLEVLEKLPDDIPNFCEVELLKAEDYLDLNQYQKGYEILTRILQSCNDKNITLTAEYLLKQKPKKENG